MNLLERTKKNEGFESKPYQDHLGNWTFGHGLTWISESESAHIVVGRLRANNKSLMAIYPWLSNHPQEVIDVVVEMSYQMGVEGVNGFQKMWGAIQKYNYELAAKEMLDSQWSRQTPNRAKSLANIMSKQ